MPEPLTSYILEWRTCYLQLSSDFNNLYNDIIDASNQCTAHNWEGLANSFSNMNVHIWDIKNRFMGQSRSLRNVMYDAMHYVDENIGGGAAVDMDAILDAIWDSDKLRWFHFINYIDAMRAGIWNTEIYEAHLVDWYIHFSEQSS